MKATEIGGNEPITSNPDEHVYGHFIPPRAKSLKQLLQHTTVEHVLASHGDIHSITSSDTVETALQTFRDHCVSSVPVYVGDKNSKFIGLLDTKDVLEYFLSLSKEQRHEFFQKKVGDLAEVSKFSPTQIVPVGTPLLEVLPALAKGDVHRVGVKDPASDSLFNIISQMTLVQFIARNISMLETKLRNVPVSDFMKQIISVENIPSDTNTHKSFEYLFRNNISAAAIVNSDGIVTDTLSMSDLVGMLYDKLEHIDSSVLSFLSSTRRTKSTKPPITCQLTDTLEYTLLKLASTKVHRLWVVDGESNRYLGLVSLTDILAFFAREFTDAQCC